MIDLSKDKIILIQHHQNTAKVAKNSYYASIAPQYRTQREKSARGKTKNEAKRRFSFFREALSAERKSATPKHRREGKRSEAERTRPRSATAGSAEAPSPRRGGTRATEERGKQGSPASVSPALSFIDGKAIAEPK